MSAAATAAAGLHEAAERALGLMRGQGFEHAQASASASLEDELNIAHNQASLLRSTEARKLALLGLIDGRKASTEVSDWSDSGLRASIRALFASAASAPQDAANAVSAGQRARIEQGPLSGSNDVLADKVGELLAYRAQATPKMMIDEGFAAHTRVTTQTLTTGGSDLRCCLGWYSLSVFGTARDGAASSSFNHADGASHDLAGTHAAELFGIGAMLRDTERQIHTAPIAAKFVGDVVLTPNAVGDLLGWLLGQIGDQALIVGSSLYREQVGTLIASPRLGLRSRFDAPGVAALSADGFVAAPVEILRDGRLLSLTPSLYGSRKTGLPHVPVAGSGWEITAGDTALESMIADTPRGALVGRLSMGQPAPNGDFSGVIKNSFSITGGTVGQALSEAMISGNIARMLHDVVAVSRERIDSGRLVLPWLRIGGLHFS